MTQVLVAAAQNCSLIQTCSSTCHTCRCGYKKEDEDSCHCPMKTIIRITTDLYRLHQVIKTQRMLKAIFHDAGGTTLRQTRKWLVRQSAPSLKNIGLHETRNYPCIGVPPEDALLETDSRLYLWEARWRQQETMGRSSWTESSVEVTRKESILQVVLLLANTWCWQDVLTFLRSKSDLWSIDREHAMNWIWNT